MKVKIMNEMEEPMIDHQYAEEANQLVNHLFVVGANHQFAEEADHQFVREADHLFIVGANHQFVEGANRLFVGANHQFEEGANHQFEEEANHQFVVRANRIQQANQYQKAGLVQEAKRSHFRLANLDREVSQEVNL